MDLSMIRPHSPPYSLKISLLLFDDETSLELRNYQSKPAAPVFESMNKVFTIRK